MIEITKKNLGKLIPTEYDTSHAKKIVEEKGKKEEGIHELYKRLGISEMGK